MIKIKNRPITNREKWWLRRGLSTLATGQHSFGGATNVDTNQISPAAPPIDPKPYLDQVNSLRVIGQCGCGGCLTIAFEAFNFRRHEQLLVATAAVPRTGWIIIYACKKTRRLIELECHPKRGLKKLQGKRPLHPPADPKLEKLLRQIFGLPVGEEKEKTTQRRSKRKPADPCPSPERELGLAPAAPDQSSGATLLPKRGSAQSKPALRHGAGKNEGNK